MSRKWTSLAVVALAVGIYCVVYESDNFEPQSIRGKRVVITGASSGIGEELAYAYSRLGASVLLTARRAQLLERVATKCKTLGAQRAEHVPADMTRSEDRERVVLEVEKRFGGLDHLILNHAVYIARPFVGSPQNMTSLQRDLNVNFVSYAHMAAMSVKMLSMSKDGIGRIGVVSSGAGKMLAPLLSSYSADKYALQGFFSSWRQELRSTNTPVSITLCVLGYIRTETADKMMTEHYPKMLAVMPTDPPSAEDTAVVIMKAVTRGAYEIYHPKWFIGISIAIHSLIPGYMEDYVGSYMT